MSFSPRDGALNLLNEALAVQRGQKMALVCEDPSLGTYDALAPRCVHEIAQELGVDVTVLPISGGDETYLSDALKLALDAYDHVLFMAGIGDTLRFSPNFSSAKRTMCYTLDIGGLGSSGATVSFTLMRKIQLLLESECGQARRWHITCPLGTDICGTQNAAANKSGKVPDFSMTRFPVCTPRPTLCSDATGVVALTQWLLPTGNSSYDYPTLPLHRPVLAIVENGQILRFEGEVADTEAATAHYQRIGKIFGINPWSVHSWHAGMNPGISYPVSAHSDPIRWGKTAFANPRYLHFHTCGDYAPGEICWSVFDATITMDDKTYWRDGHFCFLDRADLQTLLAEHGYPRGLEVRRDIGMPLQTPLRAS